MEYLKNKNFLMLLIVGFYIFALVAVLYNFQIFATFLVLLLSIWAIYKNIFSPKYLLICNLIFYFGIFNISLKIKDTDILLNIAPKKATIQGQIISIPQTKDYNKQKFFFLVDNIEYDNKSLELKNEKTFVTLTNCNKKLKLYDSYKIEGVLSTPFKAGNPSQFDYGNYLRNFNSYSVFYGKENNCISKINHSKTLYEKSLQYINNYREKIITKHSKIIKTPNLELLGGIVFGDDAISPPENIKNSFTNSGLLHILAASGMNVAFIFSFFYYFLSLFKVNFKLNISFCILMIITYSLMTGLGPSVVRATLMLIFVLIGKLIDRDTHSIALLSFVAFLMLIYNPMYLNDVGFQLSFLVTFGLLLSAPFLNKFKNKIISWIIGTITVPVIAQLWVIPLQIFYFNNISVYSIFANILSVPILSIVSFIGFINSLLGFIIPNTLFNLFDCLLNPLLTLIINISDFWGNLPNSIAQTSHPSIFQLILYYLILSSLTLLINSEIREKYLHKIKNFVLILTTILLISLIPIKNSNLEIITFDVGNADSFLIKTPKNEYFIIDTGKSGYNGGKSQAEIVILKYLKDNGIKNVEGIILTHFDNDHSGGIIDLVNKLNIKNIYINSLNHSSKEAQFLYKNLKSKLILTTNNQLIYNKSNVKITNYITQKIKENDDNESSIITLIEYDKFKMLFTGDAGIRTLKEIKTYLPQNITILKVGHHGAFGSIDQNLIKYFNPQISIISVGENKFGHPSIYTLNILRNTQILRTDNNNSIKIITNKNNFKIYTYNSLKRKYIQKKVPNRD